MGLGFVLGGCGTSPDMAPAPVTERSTNARLYTPAPAGTLALPDRVAFLQKDKRWGGDRLGGTKHETIATDGCVVTATAMALTNLGFETNPGDLNARLIAEDSFTSRGWLIWDGIRKVTDGGAYAKFYNTVSADIIDGCLADGYYPLTRFVLPNGRTHWAMVVARDGRGYHMRDPLRQSNSPLIFPRGADAFKSVRCIGVKRT
ncbi:hypothetical protein [Fretibacter rubidus]|uniref:hypothetical protein n=1 Tax=Fretibacter rubidus TaxID=570162 RepID=UPI00352A1B1D